MASIQIIKTPPLKQLMDEYKFETQEVYEIVESYAQALKDAGIELSDSNTQGPKKFSLYRKDEEVERIKEIVCFGPEGKGSGFNSLSLLFRDALLIHLLKKKGVI